MEIEIVIMNVELAAEMRALAEERVRELASRHGRFERVTLTFSKLDRDLAQSGWLGAMDPPEA